MDLSVLKLQDFADHNRALFHDDSLPEEKFQPIATPDTQHIMPAKLTNTIQHAFKANRSSG
jgi:Reverse transcriptase (RNA-dependent DNA polymerase)